MKRNPRGFEAIDDPELAAALRLKSIICRREIPDASLADPALVSDLTRFARDALPLLEWGWSAVVDTR